MEKKAGKRSGPSRPHRPEIQLDLFEPAQQPSAEQPISSLPLSNNSVEMCGDRWIASGSPWFNKKEQ